MPQFARLLMLTVSSTAVGVAVGQQPHWAYDPLPKAVALPAVARAENVGSGGGYRATMVAAPGLVSGLRSALGGPYNAGGTWTYAAAAIARLAGDGSGEGGGEAAASVLGAAPGVVHALTRALDEAEAGGDASCAATCAEALRRLLRCEEAGASEELVRRVNALTMRE